MSNQMTYNQYLQMLNDGIICPLIKIEFLHNEDENPKSSIIRLPLEGSSLTADASAGIRRSVSLVLDNCNKDFLPNINSLWINLKFQLYLGYIDKTYGEIWFPQGEFVLYNNDPEVISDYTNKTVNVKADDKWCLASNVPLGHCYVIKSGTKITDAVRSILILIGDKKVPIIEDFVDVAPYDLIWSASKTYGNILHDLTNLYSRESFYDATGHFVFRKFVDQVTSENIVDFSTNTRLYMGASRLLKFSTTYNHVYVIGGNMNSGSSGVTYTGEAKNEDLTSNTCIQIIGDKPMPPITDSNIYSNELCNERAQMELTKAKRVQESISIKSIPLYHIDVDKACTVYDESIDCYGKRFIIQQFSLPLWSTENMSITAYLFSDSSDFADRLSMNTDSSN